MIFTSCKDNSTSSDDISVEITDGSAAVIELNTCDIDSGSFATEFRFTLQLDAPSDVDIDGIEFDLTFQSGADISSLLQDSFNRSDQTVQFDYCFRYGSHGDWFELNLKILAEDEEIESNEYTIRVDRPEGANKGIISSGKN